MAGRLEVLDREYIPQDLHHREGQIEQLKRALLGFQAEGSAQLVTIFGPSGSGKTTLAKYVTRRFEEESRQLETGYANCIDDKTPTQLLQTLLRETGLRPARQPTSAAKCLAEFRDCSEPLLMTIDDLDHLNDPGFIKSLAGIRHIGLILIGIDEYAILAKLPDGVRNRVQATRTVRLPRYTNNQIEDILWGRIDLGFHPDLITRPAVRAIAEWAQGDAYRAITLLRECVKTRDYDMRQVIDDEFVDVTAADFVPVPHELGTHPRLIYDTIKQAESITASELKQRYNARAPNPRGDSMRRRYLKMLERRGLISSTGSGRGTRYHFEGA